MTQKEEPKEYNWKEFAYLLANALGDEVHYSQTPSQNTLDLLDKARILFPNSELVERLDAWAVTKIVPVD